MFSKTVKEIRELSEVLSLYLDEVDEDSSAPRRFHC